MPKKITRNKKSKRFVLIRSSNAGVFAGDLVEQDNANQRVVLQNAIRLWYWDGAFTLSQLAEEGISKPYNCKFAMPVTQMDIFDVIEILSVSGAAEKSIKGVTPCKT